MRIWRIARGVYNPLDGEGARRVGGRWNRPGTAVVYASAHLSLAVLEQLVHVDLEDLPDDLAPFEIEVPDTLLIEVVSTEDLPSDWNRAAGHPTCQQIGEQWAHTGASPVLRVPSAILAQERNYLINPAHEDASKIQVAEAQPFTFDERLRRA